MAKTARPPSRRRCLVGKRRVVMKCGKTGSPRPAINCTAMAASIRPGTSATATMWIERVPELAAEQVRLPVEGAALLR
jgi:hypothetical protein